MKQTLVIFFGLNFLFGCSESRESKIESQSKEYLAERVARLNNGTDQFELSSFTIDSIFPLSSFQLNQGIYIRNISEMCMKKDSLKYAELHQLTTDHLARMNSEVKRAELDVIEFENTFSGMNKEDTVCYGVLVSFSFLKNNGEEIPQRNNRLHIYDKQYKLDRERTKIFEYYKRNYNCNDLIEEKIREFNL